MKEIWKPITGYKYNYQISNLGRFQCLDSFHKSKRHPTYGHRDVYGYLRVSLTTIENKVIQKKVHRLVAMCFLDDYSDMLTVNHKDLDKINNNILNLEMLTASDNCIHYQENKRQLSSSSKVRGIGFHSSIKKWTARVIINGKRVSIGVYDTEYEAIEAKAHYEKDNNPLLLSIGKGVKNKGRSKYTKEEKLKALELASEIGVRKAGKITGMGSTGISTLRKKLKLGEI